MNWSARKSAWLQRPATWARADQVTELLSKDVPLWFSVVAASWIWLSNHTCHSHSVLGLSSCLVWTSSGGGAQGFYSFKIFDQIVFLAICLTVKVRHTYNNQVKINNHQVKTEYCLLLKKAWEMQKSSNCFLCMSCRWVSRLRQHI